MDKNANNKNLYASFAVLIAATVLGLVLYNSIMAREMADSARQTIEELMEQKKFTFLSRMEGGAKVAETIASLLVHGVNDFEDKEDVLHFLRDAESKSRFSRVWLADPSGQALTSMGTTIDVRDRECFTRALNGETCISDPLASAIVEGQTVVNFVTPVMVDNKIIAVFNGTYVISDLSSLFSASYQGKGYAYIVDANGEMITRASRQTNGIKANILLYLRDAEILKHDTYETIVSNMKAGHSGHAVYRKNDEKRLLHYIPLDLNGWYIFMTVSDEVISSQENHIMYLTVILTVCISLIFGGLMVYLIISQRKYSNMLFKKAYYHDLTDSPNLIKFREEGDRLLQQKPARSYAAMRISIECLDFLNEIFSYVTGDKIIKAAAESFKQVCNPQTDCFGHIYGDRFVALFACDDMAALRERRAEFERLFNEKVDGIVNYKVNFAVGLYMVEPGETDMYTVVEKVSFAHHTAKKNDRLEEKIQEYDSKLKEALTLERDVEAKMEKALANREFTMFLQPKYRLANDRLEGAEALARWWINGRYVMYPTDFIPIFEKNGFVVNLDIYMFEEACKFIRNLIDSGKEPITISTNFSRLHLLKGGFVERLREIASRYAVPHNLLEVEITESSMVGNEALLKTVLSELHETGFTLSMDDFGSGYSSLGLLKEIPIDVVKIDRSFFESSKEVERERIVIESVIDMAKKLKIHTVAEGVETQEHIDFLKELGCEIVQGYFYAKPMPFSEFAEKYF